MSHEQKFYVLEAKGIGTAISEDEAIALRDRLSRDYPENSYSLWALIPAEEAKQARARIAELELALATLFGCVEAGVLVRSTTGDGEPGWALKMQPGWALKMLGLVTVLKKCDAALAKPAPPSDETKPAGE